ncbi:MAG TPA: nucleotidyltransferase domain-containing protein [Candidatus Acidoferrales bacterium]|jgi:predicted nucleotidyltransferase|nr:nucleotidyltransferase domain-containing protein [Candidatus Acidoferrales bacterium]
MEEKFSELLDWLKNAAATNLKAVVLYGSAVAGDFHEQISDLNILLVVEQAGSAELEKLHPIAEWWAKKGNPPPIVFTMDELVRSADVFAIELLDIKRHHRMLHGADFFDGFNVPMELHRLQVERELRTAWLRLREAILTAPQKNDVHLQLMVRSISSFCVLFRHALIALQHGEAHTKREAVEAVAVITGGNPTGFQTILDFRAGKLKEKEIDVEATLHTYLEFVEVVTNDVDRRLDGAK